MKNMYYSIDILSNPLDEKRNHRLYTKALSKNIFHTIMFRRILLVLTDSELRSKLIKILLLLVAARFLAFIPIPFLDAGNIALNIDSEATFALLNAISGGAYGRLSFVMLGIGPYITASIVIQLLGVIVPKIAEIQKEEGNAGKQKINRWTRMLVIPLAMLNAWGILQYLSTDQGQKLLPANLTETSLTPQGFWSWLGVILCMTAGSVIMMWIGEIITEFKMGNGTSLLILSGIVVRLPQQFGSSVSTDWANLTDAWSRVFSNGNTGKLLNFDVWKAFLYENPTWDPFRQFVLSTFVFIVTLFLVVFINDAVRRLQVVYTRHGVTDTQSRTLSQVKADLPVKVNMAGVIPIIFAVSFILFPTIISRFLTTSNIESVRTFATGVETYLSTEANTDPLTGVAITQPENAPNQYVGVYATQNLSQIAAVNNYDTTKGQDLFGFTITTFREAKAENGVEVKNVLFDGTPLRFDFNSGNLNFLPEFAIKWNGVLSYTFFYFILIIFFTYFYTSTVAFKTDDVADNLQKSGAYIPGYKPGVETQEYLGYIANRLNVAGSVFLAIIALVPFLLKQGDSSLNSIVGGTTLLILVSVTIETLRQIEAQATAVDYDRFTQY